MRTQRATRYSHPMQHASYGIVNWFKGRGIKNQDVIMECMAAFCIKKECKWVNKDTKEIALVGYCQQHFQEFTTFTVPYLKENNYLPLPHQKV